MLRFSLVRIEDFGWTRWQVHKADCPDIKKLIKEGAFMEIVSAVSPEALVQSEIDFHLDDGRIKDDYAILTCCRESK
jgi:hypothetical protein